MVGVGMCLPGLGAAPLWGFPLGEGQLVCVESAQVWSLRTVNPLGYLDTLLCVYVCVRTCMHVMCAIPEATTVTVSKNITLS